MKNDYYCIAMNDLKYLEVTLNTNFYNNISVGAQQVSEKMLKSVLEQVAPATDLEVDRALKSPNLRAIYDKIQEFDTTIVLDRKELSMLKDYYFDAKYPGDNFVTVTKAECNDNLKIMYNVIEQVNKFRKSNNLEILEYSEPGLDSLGGL